ncbi:hypothetical protein [Pararhodobacter sp. CCB-MM2]|uniref:hypothetical protein n=1 Tax=Pararhodobacter sp. CCB-MM2 TaxID=1786003 RepID=UPI000830B1A3|nr:hypothetical protein [Pararhodobacter sp. CCB-MM2]MCA2014056.1 hypothetical protein [Cereibacter sphaeroides]
MTSSTVSLQQPALCQPVRVSGFGQLLKRVAELRAIARQRRDLAALDTHRLFDLGLDAQAAQREAARPFWDAPSYWR